MIRAPLLSIILKIRSNFLLCSAGIIKASHQTTEPLLSCLFSLRSFTLKLSSARTTRSLSVAKLVRSDHNRTLLVIVHQRFIAVYIYRSRPLPFLPPLGTITFFQKLRLRQQQKTSFTIQIFDKLSAGLTYHQHSLQNGLNYLHHCAGRTYSYSSGSYGTEMASRALWSVQWLHRQARQ